MGRPAPLGSRANHKLRPTDSPTDHARMGVEAALFDDQTPLISDRRGLKKEYNKMFQQQVKVGVGFQVVRIHQIDEAAETFTLDFDMLLTWRDPSLLDVMEPDWEKAWSPMIVFRNKIEAEQISSKTFVSDPSTGVVFSFVKYHSTHYEMLELDAFPFDRQLLHLDISSSRPSNELCFTQFPGRENKVFAMPISMWNVVRSSAPPTLVTPERALLASADDLLYPRASFEIRVERRSQWYLANVLFVTWGTVVASSVTYSIDVVDIADRMCVNVTLMLTVVALKFTFAESLPKKAYLTWLDKYMLTAFGLLVLQSAELWIAQEVALASPSTQRLLEGAFVVVIYGAWTLFHVYVALFSERLYLPWETVARNQRAQVLI